MVEALNQLVERARETAGDRVTLELSDLLKLLGRIEPVKGKRQAFVPDRGFDAFA